MVRVLLQLPAFDIIFTKVQSFLETPYRVCVCGLADFDL